MEDIDIRLQALGPRLRFGAALGVGFGVVYAVVATVLLSYGAGRSARDIPITILYALYLGGGFITGGIFGLLAPLARRRAGAVLVGFLAMLPTSLLIVLAISKDPFNLTDLLVPGIISALALGGGGGFQLWEPLGPPPPRRNPFANL